MFGPPEFSSATEDAENKQMAAIRAGNSFFVQIIQHRQRFEKHGKVRKITVKTAMLIDAAAFANHSPPGCQFDRGMV